MDRKKIAIVVISGLALFGVGFFLGVLWSGHFHKALYASIHKNSASIDRVTGEIARGKMAESGLGTSGADDPAALGDFYFESGRYAEAVEQYRSGLESSPDDPNTLNDLGLALFYSGKADEAIETLVKAADAHPGGQRLQLSCGYVLMGSGRSAEAEKYLEAALEIDPGNSVGAEAEKFLGMIKAQ
ncbi:MAG: tetratricopeptide repeat protein [bacterium]